MQAYVASLSPSDTHIGQRARDKLLELSDRQFEELCVDVYDELLRRQVYDEPNHQFLPESRLYHPKRNQARKKLSALLPLRFGHLVEDILLELKRRRPYLQNFSSAYSPRGPNTPPPPLQFRGPHWSTLTNEQDTIARESPTIQPRKMQPTPLQSDNNSNILTSCRVNMDDSCSKVLPAVLRKYGIVASWTDYSLHIVYGDEERCLELDEKPLRLFKMLEEEGKSPRLMLRKARFASVMGERE